MQYIQRGNRRIYRYATYFLFISLQFLQSTFTSLLYRKKRDYLNLAAGWIHNIHPPPSSSTTRDETNNIVVNVGWDVYLYIAIFIMPQNIMIIVVMYIFIGDIIRTEQEKGDMRCFFLYDNDKTRRIILLCLLLLNIRKLEFIYTDQTTDT